jgi:hypothetical protein
MTSTDNAAPGRVRASDVEREEYAKVIRTAMTEGRLNLEEGEDRLSKVYATVYRDELGPIVADLPPSTMFNSPEFATEARNRLRRHTGRVVSAAALLTGIWLLVAILAHPVFFWPIIPIAIMSIGLARHRRWVRWQQSGWNPWAGGGWPGPHHGHHGHGHHGRRGGWGHQGWAYSGPEGAEGGEAAGAGAGPQGGPGWPGRGGWQGPGWQGRGGWQGGPCGHGR